MTAFLAELGAKLADKWLTLLVLPGLIYLACAAAADELGQRRALDAGALRGAVNRVAGQPAAGSAGAIIVAAVAVLAAAAAAGLAANGLGRLVERAWTAEGNQWPASLLVRRRQRRWDEAGARVEQATITAGKAERGGQQGPEVADRIRQLNKAIMRKDAISMTQPRRPMWIGDRILAVDERVHVTYDIDLTSVWPRLWLTMPDTARAELTSATDAYGASARLAAWAVLYVAIAWRWWPALLIAAGLGLTAWVQGRDRTANLADLIEAAVDVYARDLAVQLGLPADGPLTPETGLAITSALRKDPEEHRQAPRTS